MRKVFGLLASLLIGAQALGSVSVTVNGTSYTIPQKNEKGWGDNVTSWIQAISSNTVQPTGGVFTLSADLDWGASYGTKSNYYKSRSSNIASLGVLRLANTDSVGWRNTANSANLLLGVNTSDQLTFNGNPIIGSSALTASRALQSDSGGAVSASSVTSTELGYVSGVTSSLCGISQSCTITNKTLTSPVISSIVNTGTLTLPISTDTLVGRATTDTLTNKTLTAPAISTISNTGTLTLPTSTDTLVGRATTDTLTNKVISGSSNTITNVSLSSGVTGTLPIANGGTGQTSAASAFGALSPLTTKGDVLVYGSSNSRLPVGADGNVLTLDSAQSLGLKWAAPGAFAAIGFSANNAATYTTVGGSLGSTLRIVTVATPTINTGTAFGTATGVFTVQSAGKYLITAQISLTGTSNGSNCEMQAQIRKNSSAQTSPENILPFTSGTCRMVITTTYEDSFSANDTIDVRTSSTMTSPSFDNCSYTITYVGS